MIQRPRWVWLRAPGTSRSRAARAVSRTRRPLGNDQCRRYRVVASIVQRPILASSRRKSRSLRIPLACARKMTARRNTRGFEPLRKHLARCAREMRSLSGSKTVGGRAKRERADASAASGRRVAREHRPRSGRASRSDPNVQRAIQNLDVRIPLKFQALVPNENPKPAKKRRSSTRTI